jgi:sortase A
VITKIKKLINKSKPPRKKTGRMALSTWVMFIAGLLILAYPIFAQAYNAVHQSGAVSSVTYDYAQDREADLAKLQAKVEKRNAQIKANAAKDDNVKVNSALQALGDKKKYESGAQIKNLNGKKGAAMAVLSIPTLGGLRLPLYDGVSEKVLRSGAGLLEGTSVPAKGQKGLHAVITSHAGLPDAKLFTSLGNLAKGDKFYIEIMNETITYEVKKIKIIKPDKLDGYFKVNAKKNQATLVTCTPLGINSHRLLVTGEEVKGDTVPKTAVRAEFMTVGVFIVAASLLTWFMARKKITSKAKLMDKGF